ncbi:D-inositol-3-phosphate glycosyltransferase [ANME-1 cluster archaeon GoMg3.2]|nr:D-inositol-3-phosphate glycosyltransferase [ANME-1 cluster archaeon GoMg3.2]
MKICIISSLYPPFIIGGAEISVKRAAEELVKRGHEVFVISTSQNRKSSIGNINGVKVYRINPLNLYAMYNYQNQPELLKPIWHVIDLWNPHSYIIIKNILKKGIPDVVHINNFKGLSLSVFSAAKHLNLPLIFTAHDYSLICPRTNLLHGSGKICNTPSRFCMLYNKIQKYLVNDKPDLVTAPSQFVIDKLKSSGLFDGVKTIKLPLGIELNVEKAKKKYDLIDILYVGALSRHKGVHILIDAFKGLEYKNIKLHIVGKGKDEDAFKRIAGLDRRISFHGFVPDEELMKLYQKANITVVPSVWYDNSPMVIYESFKNGTPVIGSRIGGIPELVEDKYNGFLFEAGDVCELKEMLENPIKNPDELKRLEEGAFASVKKYDVNKHIRKLEAIYNGF